MQECVSRACFHVKKALLYRETQRNGIVAIVSVVMTLADAAPMIMRVRRWLMPQPSPP